MFCSNIYILPSYTALKCKNKDFDDQKYVTIVITIKRNYAPWGAFYPSA